MSVCPQVAIDSSLAAFGDAVRRLNPDSFGESMASVKDPRSVEQLQSVLDLIVQEGKARN